MLLSMTRRCYVNTHELPHPSKASPFSRRWLADRCACWEFMGSDWYKVTSWPRRIPSGNVKVANHNKQDGWGSRTFLCDCYGNTQSEEWKYWNMRTRTEESKTRSHSNWKHIQIGRKAERYFVLRRLFRPAKRRGLSGELADTSRAFWGWCKMKIIIKIPLFDINLISNSIKKNLYNTLTSRLFVDGCLSWCIFCLKCLLTSSACCNGAQQVPDVNKRAHAPVTDVFSERPTLTNIALKQKHAS